jgi:hypothetical protein
LINKFESIDFNSKQLNDSFNQFQIFPEHFIQKIFKESDMKLIKQKDFFMVFRTDYIRYFKGINWNHYDDYINIECPPRNLDKMHLVRNTIKNINKIIILNFHTAEENHLYFYDFVSHEEPIYYKELMVSAFTPDKIICNSNHYLYDFIKKEFQNKLQ